MKVFDVGNKLPQEVNNEEDVDKYMKVLRKTTAEIGKSLMGERLQKKAEEKELKKLQNINFVKNKLNAKKNENKNRNSVKKRIKEMRSKRLFPLPKSYMNYKNRNGLLGRNSINVER